MAEQSKVNSRATNQKRPRVQSLARAASILLAIADSENGLTTKEIRTRLGLSLQTTYHLLHTLAETGLVTRNESNNYVVGLSVSTLAEALKRQVAAPEFLAPAVREIARKTGESAYASGWWSGEIVNLGSAPGRYPVYAKEVPHGYSRDAHARASGKLLLAYATPATRDEYLRTHPMRRITVNTITTMKAFARELDSIRRQEYSVDQEELMKDICCISVPLASGRIPYCLTLTSPTDRFKQQREQYLATLQRIAASVSGQRNYVNTR